MEAARPFGRFSARDRIRKRSHFQRIQETGQRVVCTNFVFLIERGQSDGGPRLGVTASRRVGNAPARNRAKRLVREAFRALRSAWPPDAEVVVIVRGALGERKLCDVIVEWQAAQARIARSLARLSARAETLAGAENGAPTNPLPSKKSC